MCIRDRVIGILPQYRKEVIKDIILWKESRYFIEEKPTRDVYKRQVYMKPK